MVSQVALAVEPGASQVVLLALARRTKVLRAVLLTTVVWLLAMVVAAVRLSLDKMLPQAWAETAETELNPTLRALLSIAQVAVEVGMATALLRGVLAGQAVLVAAVTGQA